MVLSLFLSEGAHSSQRVTNTMYSKGSFSGNCLNLLNIKWYFDAFIITINAQRLKFEQPITAVD